MYAHGSANDPEMTSPATPANCSVILPSVVSKQQCQKAEGLINDVVCDCSRLCSVLVLLSPTRHVRNAAVLGAHWSADIPVWK